jgi:hypothetical protein
MAKYSVNLDYFKDIDTEAKAYFLGFIAADGHNMRSAALQLTLHESDVEILESLKKECAYSGPLILKKSAKQIALTVNRKDFIKNLENHGIIQRKTFSMKFPDIEEQLIKHYIRGYFDGDGTLGLTTNKKEIRASIVGGCKPFLAELKQVIENVLGITCSIGNRKSKISNNIHYVLYISGNNNTIKFLDWVYQGSNFFLTRKKNKYLEGKKFINENIRRMPHRRQVSKLDLEGNVLEKYENTVLAGVKNNVFHQNIRVACLNPNRTCGGFKWRFEQ